MLKHKRARARGKISFTRFFQTFKPGESVAVVKEHSVPFGYSNRIHGRTGKIIAKRGACYEIEVNDLAKPKRYVLKPIHLKKIEDKQ